MIKEKFAKFNIEKYLQIPEEYKYKLKLYDKDGNTKIVKPFKSHLLAWHEGINWEMLSSGNRFEIIVVEKKIF